MSVISLVQTVSIMSVTCRPVSSTASQVCVKIYYACILVFHYLNIWYFSPHTLGVSVCAVLCVCVWPPPFTLPAGSVSCACCADNQCVTLAGSVQQEQGTGLNILHTHKTHFLSHIERETQRAYFIKSNRLHRTETLVVSLTHNV